MTEVRVSDGLTIKVPAGTSLGRAARVSRHEFLRLAIDVLAQAKSACSPFSDWAARALDCTAAEATCDADDLFADYHRFCAVAGVMREDRHSFAGFGRALDALGLRESVDDLGRAVRIGCQLRAVAVELAIDIPAADAERAFDEWLGAECVGPRSGAPTWIKASELHAAYFAWAWRNARPCLSTRAIAHRLIERGVSKKVSNGVRYALALRESGAPDLFTPAPPASAPSGSGVDRPGNPAPQGSA